MDVQPDFRDLLALFNEHDVECMIVGAYALAFHGAPRYTGDMDILVKPSIELRVLLLKNLPRFENTGRFFHNTLNSA